MNSKQLLLACLAAVAPYASAQDSTQLLNSSWITNSKVSSIMVKHASDKLSDCIHDAAGMPQQPLTTKFIKQSLKHGIQFVLEASYLRAKGAPVQGLHKKLPIADVSIDASNDFLSEVLTHAFITYLAKATQSPTVEACLNDELARALIELGASVATKAITSKTLIPVAAAGCTAISKLPKERVLKPALYAYVCYELYKFVQAYRATAAGTTYQRMSAGINNLLAVQAAKKIAASADQLLTAVKPAKKHTR